MDTRYCNQRPICMGFFDVVECTEFFNYQYLPIKLAEEPYLHSLPQLPVYEKRLKVFKYLIDSCCKDFYRVECKSAAYKWSQYNIYLTAKRAHQKEGCGFNRPGYHTDGFGDPDSVNYIWSDSQPTIFNYGNFFLSEDHSESMVEMEEQADPKNEITYPDFSLIKLTPYVIHKVGSYKEGIRTFFKLSFSKEKYDLEGNSHNYELDYDWKMRPRNKERNVPSST